MRNNNLITFLSALIDLLNRKKTYEDVISEKKKQGLRLGIEKKESMPIYPKINYEFSVGRFVLKSILFAIVYIALVALIDKIAHLISASVHDTVLSYGILFLPLGAMVPSAVTELRSRILAKNAADLSYNHAVERVTEQHRQDDLRITKERELARIINAEIIKWQEKLDFVNDTIEKACEFGNITDEYRDIEVLTVFLEYLKEQRCSDIGECKLKYDESMRRMDISYKVDELEMQIEEFEYAFAEAVRQSKIYLGQRIKEVQRLCHQQAKSLDEIEYNQETTRQGLFMLSLLD